MTLSDDACDDDRRGALLKPAMSVYTSVPSSTGPEEMRRGGVR